MPEHAPQPPVPISTPAPPSPMLATAAMAVIRRRPARAVSLLAGSLCGLLAATLLYASLAKMDVVVSIQGKVIPSGRSKVVQPLDAGVVRAIHVRDGQSVSAGDVLVELDATAAAADHERAQREHWEAKADAARARAMLDGRTRMPVIDNLPEAIAIAQQARLGSGLAEHKASVATLEAEMARSRAARDGAAAALAQIEASLPLLVRRHGMREALASTGHIAEAGLIETRMELLHLQRELALQRSRVTEAAAGLQAVRLQRARADAAFIERVSMELADANRRLALSVLELRKTSQRNALQTLRAPIAGVVQQLAVSTVGGIVTPAQPIATVVPADTALEVEAQIPNKDAGHIRPGQRAIAKVETFDYTRFGHIDGEVQWVGTDAINDPRLGPVYPVRIRLHRTDTPIAVNGRRGTLIPGMALTADIRVDERRMISYFLSPLIRYGNEALRER